MKTSIYTLIIICFLCTCSTTKKEPGRKNTEPEECAKFTILDSIKLIETFPDEYYNIPADTISKKILSSGNVILPCLIEKMKDTTVTKVRIADSYNYLVGDVATMLIFNDRDRNVYLKQFLFQEFESELRDEEPDLFIFEQVYYKLFFANESSVNYSHRLRFYELVKREIGNSMNNEQVVAIIDSGDITAVNRLIADKDIKLRLSHSDLNALNCRDIDYTQTEYRKKNDNLDVLFLKCLVHCAGCTDRRYGYILDSISYRVKLNYLQGKYEKIYGSMVYNLRGSNKQSIFDSLSAEKRQEMIAQLEEQFRQQEDKLMDNETAYRNTLKVMKRLLTVKKMNSEELLYFLYANNDWKISPMNVRFYYENIYNPSLVQTKDSIYVYKPQDILFNYISDEHPEESFVLFLLKKFRPEDVLPFLYKIYRENPDEDETLPFPFYEMEKILMPHLPQMAEVAGHTLLHAAVVEGDIALVRKLVNGNPKLIDEKTKPSRRTIFPCYAESRDAWELADYTIKQLKSEYERYEEGLESKKMQEFRLNRQNEIKKFLEDRRRINNCVHNDTTSGIRTILDRPNKDSIMDDFKLTKSFEQFDEDRYNSRSDKEDDLIIDLPDGTHIELTTWARGMAYSMLPKNSHFKLVKTYYLNRNIESKGFMINNGDARFGIWYEYNENGELVNEVNYDTPYTYTIENIIQFCNQNNIPLQKGYVHKSFTTNINKGNDGTCYWWEIEHLKETDLIETIRLSGKTDEIMQVRTMDYINN